MDFWYIRRKMGMEEVVGSRHDVSSSLLGAHGKKREPTLREILVGDKYHSYLGNNRRETLKAYIEHFCLDKDQIGVKTNILDYRGTRGVEKIVNSGTYRGFAEGLEGKSFDEVYMRLPNYVQVIDLRIGYNAGLALCQQKKKR